MEQTQNSVVALSQAMQSVFRAIADDADNLAPAIMQSIEDMPEHERQQEHHLIAACVGLLLMMYAFVTTGGQISLVDNEAKNLHV